MTKTQIMSKNVKNISEMEDWEILTYLRENRKWMVQSHYDKADIVKIFNVKFKDDDEWNEFTEFACDQFDYCKNGIMYSIIDEWNDRD